jgi:hypothetical protein
LAEGHRIQQSSAQKKHIKTKLFVLAYWRKHMKGKITKDILLRVGQGVMRIPRDKTVVAYHDQQPGTDVTPSTKKTTSNIPAGKPSRS